MKKIIYISVFLFLSLGVSAQKGRHGNHGGGHMRMGNFPQGNYQVVKQNNRYYQQPIIIKENNNYVKRYKHHGPPAWAPANGYRHRYIYFPEYHCYYDNYFGLYIWNNGGVWVRTYTMPVFIINIYKTKKVELSFDVLPWTLYYF